MSLGDRAMRRLMALQPRNESQLLRFVERSMGLRMVTAVTDPLSSSPMDYLAHAFFEAHRKHLQAQGPCGKQRGDAVVWACRGGGKTMLGAVATLLDLIFKPGVRIRILGGSFEQSQKMYEHLTSLLERPMFAALLASPATQRRVELINGSQVELLAQSQRSVRGTRVHILRCDEVEEFDDDVWQAAQLVTRSGWCGDVFVEGRIEALSTMHRPFGLMHRLIEQSHASVFRWQAMDVVERCEPSRDCAGCELWEGCGGSAKQASGFISVDDLIQQYRRTSHRTWQSEMLCQRPSVSASVYPNFDPAKPRYVAPCPPQWRSDSGVTVIGGIDFGMRSPMAMIFALTKEVDARKHVWVVDAYAAEDRIIDAHVAALHQRQPDLMKILCNGEPSNRDPSGPGPQRGFVGVDPAGASRNSHTGLSDIDQLRRHGMRIRAQRSSIAEGVELVRRHLDRGTLTLDPACADLIRAMQQYHFDPKRPDDPNPVKDGPDHLCDALRYMLVNLETSRPLQSRSYTRASPRRDEFNR